MDDSTMHCPVEQGYAGGHAAALAEKMGNPGGADASESRRALILAVFAAVITLPTCLRQRGPCGKNRPACRGLMGRF